MQLEGRMLSTMKKDQLNFMKTTGFQSKVHENASEELYGTKTILGKSSLKRRVPQKDVIYIPESFEIKSSITTPASPRLSKHSTRSERDYQTHRQSSPISSSSLSTSLRHQSFKKEQHFGSTKNNLFEAVRASLASQSALRDRIDNRGYESTRDLKSSRRSNDQLSSSLSSMIQ